MFYIHQAEALKWINHALNIVFFYYKIVDELKIYEIRIINDIVLLFGVILYFKTLSVWLSTIY